MKGLFEYVRCKALGFKVKGVYYSTRLNLNIQSNTADCVLYQTDYLVSLRRYTITGKWSL